MGRATPMQMGLSCMKTAEQAIGSRPGSTFLHGPASASTLVSFDGGLYITCGQFLSQVGSRQHFTAATRGRTRADIGTRAWAIAVTDLIVLEGFWSFWKGR